MDEVPDETVPVPDDAAEDAPEDTTEDVPEDVAVLEDDDGLDELAVLDELTVLMECIFVRYVPDTHPVPLLKVILYHP